MSRLRPNWLLGVTTDLHGVKEDGLQPAKLLVFRNGQLLSEGEGNDYTFDGTNVDFLIDIDPKDAILLVDPSIGASRRLLGGTNVIKEEPEVAEVAPAPKPKPVTNKVEPEPKLEDTDVTSSDSGRDDSPSEVSEDEDSQPRKRSSRSRRQ